MRRTDYSPWVHHGGRVPPRGQLGRPRSRVWSRLALCLGLTLGLLTLGCASQKLRPGTGDVSFRLVWEGSADLDLHVTDPLGRHTGVALAAARGTPAEQLEAARAALAAQIAREQDGVEATGPPEGILDIDCNGSQHRICPAPIENVYWPIGTAQRGDYVFWVHLFQPLLETAPQDHVPFQLEVRRGDTVVERHEGRVDNGAPMSTRFTHAY